MDIVAVTREVSPYAEGLARASGVGDMASVALTPAVSQTL